MLLIFICPTLLLFTTTFINFKLIFTESASRPGPVGLQWWCFMGDRGGQDGGRRRLTGESPRWGHLPRATSRSLEGECRTRGGWQSPRSGSGVLFTNMGLCVQRGNEGHRRFGGTGWARGPGLGGQFHALGTHPQSKGAFTWVTLFPLGSGDLRGGGVQSGAKRPETWRSLASDCRASKLGGLTFSGTAAGWRVQVIHGVGYASRAAGGRAGGSQGGL